MSQALNFIQSLWQRDIEITLKDSDKLFVQPSEGLSDSDREFIKAHREELVALVRNGEQLGHLANGWQQSEGMSERVILVRNGRLTDSAIFRSEAGARAFLSLVNESGYPMHQAFNAACAIEDGERDRVKPCLHSRQHPSPKRHNPTKPGKSAGFFVCLMIVVG